MYYLRTKAAADAIKFTVEAESKTEAPEVLGNEDILVLERQQQMSAERQALLEAEAEKAAQITCSLDNPDACEACGS